MSTEPDDFERPQALSGQLWKNIATIALSAWALTLTAAGTYLHWTLLEHTRDDKEMRDRVIVLEQRQKMVIEHIQKLDAIDERNSAEHEAIRDAVRSNRGAGR